MDESVSTKVVAALIPIAVSTLRDTPMKGHSPRNFTNTILLTKTVLINKRNSSEKYSDIYTIIGL